MNSIASPGGSGSAGTSPLAAVLGTAQANPALLAGVLNAYQTTYAQIGRALNLSVQPRSLSTASSAEIAVTLNTDETSGGPTFVSTTGHHHVPVDRYGKYPIERRYQGRDLDMFYASTPILTD